jgi:hypothetical protein
MSLFEIDYQPERRQLRLFGAASTAFLGVLGALALPRSPTVAAALWTVAAFSGAVVLVRPDLLRWVYVGLMLVTWPLGLVVSWVVLAVLFYGVITPVGLAMRLLGRDALARRFDRGAPTYWVPRTPAGEPERYFRQY